MFTGIIQTQGTVTKKEKCAGQIRLTFRTFPAERFRRNVSKSTVSLRGGLGIWEGESIAVNGVCLTATHPVRKGKSDIFSAVAIRETLQATTLGNLKGGDRVNLERSLRAGDAVGGHFVTGHVDGVGRITAIHRKGRNRTFEIQAPLRVRKFLAVKGSIAVHGVSLTIQKLASDTFQVGLVPHTLRLTTLGKMKPGAAVNLEVDLVARYVREMFGSKKQVAGSR